MQTNFRLPETVSIALPDASRLRKEIDQDVHVSDSTFPQLTTVIRKLLLQSISTDPDSVERYLVKEALEFGGKMPTCTDEATSSSNTMFRQSKTKCYYSNYRYRKCSFIDNILIL